MMYPYYYGNMYGWGWGGGLMMLLFWALVIVLIVWAVKASRRGHGADWSAGHGKTALDILKERYAKGEIDKAEFEEKKKDLAA